MATKPNKQTVKEYKWTHLNISKDIIQIKKIRISARVILAFLKFRQGKNPTCYWSMGEISNQLNIPLHTVERDIKTLHDEWFIEKRLSRRGRSFVNEYSVNDIPTAKVGVSNESEKEASPRQRSEFTPPK